MSASVCIGGVISAIGHDWATEKSSVPGASGLTEHEEEVRVGPGVGVL